MMELTIEVSTMKYKCPGISEFSGNTPNLNSCTLKLAIKSKVVKL